MSGISPLPPIPLYLQIEADENKAVASAQAGDPVSQRLAAHFTAATASITTPQQLLGDYQSLQVVLGAFGMSSMIGQTAIIRDLMTQDPTSKTSLAATSGNTVWQAFAKQMSGWSAGATPLAGTSGAKILAAYQTATFEQNQGSSTPGMQQALYYTRAAGSITSVNALMSDQTLLDVFETVNNLDPDQFGALDFDQQQRIVTADFKASDFASPAQIKRTAERYLAMTEADPPSTTQSFTTASLFGDTGGGDGILDAIATGLGLSI